MNKFQDRSKAKPTENGNKFSFREKAKLMREQKKLEGKTFQFSLSQQIMIFQLSLQQAAHLMLRAPPVTPVY